MLSCSQWKKPTPSTATIAPKQYIILSYNVENLFDTINDLENDDDFTPKGKLSWDTKKYFEKTKHIAEVISSVGKENSFPVFIGLVEVEHLSCLETLCKEPALQNKYTPLLLEGEDERGIDVGCLYDKSRFKKLATIAHQVALPDNDKTRHILEVNGEMEGTPFSFFINHWPSRSGGTEKSAPLRMIASETLQRAIIARKNAQPDCQIICMGDFNDHPTDASVIRLKDCIDNSPMINLMESTSQLKNAGSHFYKGEWGYLDQFIVSTQLVQLNLPCAPSVWCIHETGKTLQYDFLMYTNKQNEKSPARTYVGDSYKGGYSDHLPIMIVLEK
jgi:exonuclease III